MASAYAAFNELMLYFGSPQFGNGTHLEISRVSLGCNQKRCDDVTTHALNASLSHVDGATGQCAPWTPVAEKPKLIRDHSL